MASSFLKSLAVASVVTARSTSEGVWLHTDTVLALGAEGRSAAAVNFLQLDSVRDAGSDDLSEAVRNALRNIEALSDSHRGLSEDFQMQGSDDTVPASPESNLVQVSAGTEVGQAWIATASPIPSVKEMISNLIASLREDGTQEQNQEKEKGKFCAGCPVVHWTRFTQLPPVPMNPARSRSRSPRSTEPACLKQALSEADPAYLDSGFLQPQWWIPEVDGARVGDHEFLQILGEGTHGKVYKVADPVVGGFNAVKVIRKKGKNTDELAGVMAECNTLNWLSHPNIVQLRGAVNAYKNFYVFMDFAGSVSLHKLLQNRDNQTGLDLPIARQLFHQIADAVAYCHCHGLAHCDLKPQNIVISEDGTPKIVDFGLALKLGWPVGNPRGTWPFTAPEAAWPCGRPWDLAKADVFSLGAILIEMLCGTDKLFRMFGWMAQTPLNLLRVQEMVNFLATPGAVMSSLATDLGLAATDPAPMITGLMNVVPMKRWSAKVAASFTWHMYIGKEEEQQQKAREGFKKLSAATEDAEQAKRWAESAVLDLQAQSHFLEADVSRLKQRGTYLAVTSGKTDLDAEVARIKEEVLKQHCKLSESGNCAEADSALNLANLGLEKLDKADAEKTLKLQQESLFQANADLNRRKDELAELSSDVVTAKENMRLAGKADDALSTSCGPKASSMEDTIARRKEEIEQLKNVVCFMSLLQAVKVLDGEAVKPLITRETAGACDIFYNLKPLFWALSYGAEAEVLKALLDAHPEAAKEKHPTEGWTPLHYVDKLSLESVRLLLATCPEAAHELDREGSLPLHWAAEHNAPKEVLQLLLKANGSAAERRDGFGRLPSRLAQNAGASEELVKASKPVVDKLRDRCILKSSEGLDAGSLLADSNAAGGALAAVREWSLGPYGFEWLLLRVADFGNEAPAVPMVAEWKADAAPPPLQLLIPEMIFLEKTPQILFFTDCAGFIRAVRRPMRKEPYLVHSTIEELMKSRQQMDWNCYRELESALEKDKLDCTERQGLGGLGLSVGLEVPSSRRHSGEDAKAHKEKRATNTTLKKPMAPSWRFWSGTDGSKSGREHRLQSSEVKDCFDGSREWPAGISLLQASFWTGSATPRPSFITYHYNALQTEAAGAVHERLRDIMNNHFERYTFLESVRDRNKMSAVPTQLAQHLTYYCNLELVSGEFIFYKDRKSQLWLADARNLMFVPSISRSGNAAKGGGAQEALPQKMFRYLSEEALQNLMVDEREGPKCERMFELMMHDYQAMKEKFGVDSMLRKVQQELDINVPVLEGTNVEALGRTFDIKAKHLGATQTAAQKRHYCVPTPKVHAEKGRCRWFSEGTGNQVRTAAERVRRHNRYMGQVIAKGRQRAQNAGSFSAWDPMPSAAPTTARSARSSEHGTPSPSSSLRRQQSRSKSKVAHAEPKRVQPKIEIVTTAIAQELLVGAGTGVCPEGDTMDMKRPSISQPGQGLRMTRKAAVPTARAVVVPEGAAAQAVFLESEADKLRQYLEVLRQQSEVESEKNRHQSEAESHTKETTLNLAVTGTPRDKKLGSRGSMAAHTFQTDPNSLSGTGSKGEEAPPVKSAQEEPMIMQINHKCSLLECSTASCWQLKEVLQLLRAAAPAAFASVAPKDSAIIASAARALLFRVGSGGALGHALAARIGLKRTVNKGDSLKVGRGPEQDVEPIGLLFPGPGSDASPRAAFLRRSTSDPTAAPLITILVSGLLLLNTGILVPSNLVNHKELNGIQGEFHFFSANSEYLAGSSDGNSNTRPADYHEDPVPDFFYYQNNSSELPGKRVSDSRQGELPIVGVQRFFNKVGGFLEATSDLLSPFFDLLAGLHVFFYHEQQSQDTSDYTLQPYLFAGEMASSSGPGPGGGGIPLHEFRKDVPPGWCPGLPDYPLRLYFERLKLWYQIYDGEDTMVGPLVAGRLQGKAQRLGLTLRLPRPDGTMDVGGEALARLTVEEVRDPADPTVIIQQYVPSGVQALCNALKDAFGVSDQELVSRSIEDFFEYRRGKTSFQEYAIEWDCKLEEATTRAGLQINEVAKFYLFFRNSGLPAKFVEDIKLQLQGDLRRFQEARSLALRLISRKDDIGGGDGSFYEHEEHEDGYDWYADDHEADWDVPWESWYEDGWLVMDYENYAADYEDDWNYYDGWVDEPTMEQAATTDDDHSSYHGEDNSPGHATDPTAESFPMHKGKGKSSGGCTICGSRWHQASSCPVASDGGGKDNKGYPSKGKGYGKPYGGYGGGYGKGKSKAKGREFRKGKGKGKWSPKGFRSGKGYSRPGGGYFGYTGAKTLHRSFDADRPFETPPGKTVHFKLDHDEAETILPMNRSKGSADDKATADDANSATATLPEKKLAFNFTSSIYNTVEIPLDISGAEATFKADVLGGEGSLCPALLSNPALRRQRAAVLTNWFNNGDGALCVQNEAGDSHVMRMLLTDSGHYLLPTDERHSMPKDDANAVKMKLACWSKEIAARWDDLRPEVRHCFLQQPQVSTRERERYKCDGAEEETNVTSSSPTTSTTSGSTANSGTTSDEFDKGMFSENSDVSVIETNVTSSSRTTSTTSGSFNFESMAPSPQSSSLSMAPSPQSTDHVVAQDRVSFASKPFLDSPYPKAKEDDWEHDVINNKLTRHHKTPRRILFTPNATLDCPVPHEQLSGARSTQIKTWTQRKCTLRYLEDDWRCVATPNRDLVQLWTGRTVFHVCRPQGTTSSTTTSYAMTRQSAESILDEQNFPPYAGDTFPDHWDDARVKKAKDYYRALPEEFYSRTGRRPITPGNVRLWMQNALSRKRPLRFQVWEWFSGSGRLSLVLLLANLSVGFPVDHRYGWDIGYGPHQALLRECQTAFAPDHLMAAPNCGPWSVATAGRDPGKRQADRSAELPTLEFLYESCVCQETEGHGFTVEQPLSSAMFTDSPMSRLIDQYCLKKQRLDQCMLGAQDEHGKPVRKSTVFYSNRRWHGILKRCGGHKGQGHGILQGKWAGLNRTTMAAVYPRRLCQQFCQDLMYMLKKVDRAAIHPWPRQLWWASGFFYSCERCQLGRSAPPGCEHTLVPGECRYGQPSMRNERRAPRAQEARPSTGDLEDPSAPFKMLARSGDYSGVELVLDDTITLSPENRVYLKSALTSLLKSCIGVFQEATGIDYDHWISDPVLLRVFQDVFHEHLQVLGVMCSLRPWHLKVPDPYLSSSCAPLRMLIRGGVRKWHVHAVEDMRMMSPNQLKASVEEADWHITVFGYRAGDLDVDRAEVPSAASGRRPSSARPAAPLVPAEKRKDGEAASSSSAPRQRLLEP
ncbi:Smok2b, partial [Symbiodinium necroappetens]